ncbi:adenosylmethionine-8-amino-7-oxononanoate aminotransferase [Rhodoligotrophos appendicifer]|uniref:aminotransferase family protein n=1 Tax=Rhodoligotrophos appendicifer TaxID=987056 RepID=UPI00195F6BDF|nr:aspartate aminotransferase family protein [Rhodoligotrophos appendicifer]
MNVNLRDVASLYPERGGPVQMFYRPEDLPRLPRIARAEGSYMWDTEGRRYIDGSCGPVATNIGHGNPAVLAAIKAQADRVTFANRTVFENEADEELSNLVAKLAGSGFDRAFFVSGGAEANEGAIKLARQFAVARGEASRWKVVGLEQSYHGPTAGTLAVSGDPAAKEIFGPLVVSMPKVPSPSTYRLPGNHTVESYANSCADALEDCIRREGADTVLAFIMEPVGGVATGALVPHDTYFRRVREICTKYGVLIIFDEVMAGAGRTGTFLAADHWPDCRPDLVTLAKGLAAGYTPFGAVLAPAHIVRTVTQAGGFMHGHTAAANPFSCAIALAVVNEVVDRGLMERVNETSPGFRQRLEAIAAASSMIGDVRGMGFLLAIELVVDKENKTSFAVEHNAAVRFCEVAQRNGLLLYTRRTAWGRNGDWVMVAPPLTATDDELSEILSLIEKTIGDYAEITRQWR